MTRDDYLEVLRERYGDDAATTAETPAGRTASARQRTRASAWSTTTATTGGTSRPSGCRG